MPTNDIADKILSYLGIGEDVDFLEHYGVGHNDGGHSGRYPYGSGDNPNQRDGDFYSYVNELRKSGMKDTEIAEVTGCGSTTILRAMYAQAKDERRMNNIAQMKKLYSEGLNRQQIAERMGVNESTVRSWEDEQRAQRNKAAQATADYLRQQIAEKRIIDIGDGVERELHISKEKLQQALLILEGEGYPIYGAGIHQVTNPNQQTIMKVIGDKDVGYSEAYDFKNVKTITEYTCNKDEEGNDIYEKRFTYPESLDSKRLMIVRPTEGGAEKDGLVTIRPGLADLDLQGSRYSQVRILVDGTHYIKGMAAYEDGMPDGIDIKFYTSKTVEDKPTMYDVLKPIAVDPKNHEPDANPFGSLIKPEDQGGQYHYTDPVTGERKLGLINKRSDEGDWGEWGSKVPSQFLSKQPQKLINSQLELTKADYASQFEEIKSLTNPAIRKKELLEFAGACDTAAVELKAMSFPRQSYQVLFPIGSLKDTECYAPNYKDGETLALIRYPHGGTFEIPIVKVNNKNVEAKQLLGDHPKDAIGINSKVAARLSGADFDGDSVMAIPCNSNYSKVFIKSTHPLKGLEGFDPHLEYKYHDGIKLMKKSQTGKEMGTISNLINDMNLKGATEDELARAVRHSMVVIDAAKHKLDYRQSAIDNRIQELKDKYQLHYDEEGRPHYGASTLISRAKSPYDIEKTKGSGKIDETTGKVTFKKAEEYYLDKKTGKEVKRMIRSTKMKETDDAYSLVSELRTPQELAYADFANYMKSLANQARIAFKKSDNLKYDAKAHSVYKKEVEELELELDIAKSNAPRERAAQRLANVRLKAIKEDNPGITSAEYKKKAQIELTRARALVGAKRHMIEITDKQWEAIQSGAISENRLNEILRYADGAAIKQRAMPRNTGNTISQAQQRKIEAMKNSGYTNEEIASALGVSTSTVNKYK